MALIRVAKSGNSVTFNHIVIALTGTNDAGLVTATESGTVTINDNAHSISLSESGYNNSDTTTVTDGEVSIKVTLSRGTGNTVTVKCELLGGSFNDKTLYDSTTQTVNKEYYAAYTNEGIALIDEN